MDWIGDIFNWIFQHWQPIVGGIGVTVTFVTSGISGVQAKKANAAKKEIEGATETLESLKLQVANLKQENQTFRGFFEQQKLIIDSIKLTLDETQQERDHVIEQLTLVKTKTREDEERYEAEIRRLKEQAQNSERRVQEVERRATDLERRLNTAIKENEALNQDLAKARRAGYGRGKKTAEASDTNAD